MWYIFFLKKAFLWQRMPQQEERTIWIRFQNSTPKHRFLRCLSVIYLRKYKLLPAKRNVGGGGGECDGGGHTQEERTGYGHWLAVTDVEIRSSHKTKWKEVQPTFVLCKASRSIPDITMIYFYPIHPPKSLEKHTWFSLLTFCPHNKPLEYFICTEIEWP